MLVDAEQRIFREMAGQNHRSNHNGGGGGGRAKQFGRQLKLAQDAEALSRQAAAVAQQRRAAAAEAAKAMSDAFDAAALGEEAYASSSSYSNGGGHRVDAASSAMQAAFDHVLATHSTYTANDGGGGGASASRKPKDWVKVGGQHPLLGPGHQQNHHHHQQGSSVAAKARSSSPPWGVPSRPGDRRQARRSQSVGPSSTATSRLSPVPAAQPESFQEAGGGEDGGTVENPPPRLVSIRSRSSSAERSSVRPATARYTTTPAAPQTTGTTARKGAGSGRSALQVSLDGKPDLVFDAVTTARTQSGRQVLRELRSKSRSRSSVSRPAGEDV